MKYRYFVFSAFICFCALNEAYASESDCQSLNADSPAPKLFSCINQLSVMVKNLSERPAPEKGEKGDPGRPGNDASLPTGAVVAFAKNSCPSGWDEYSPAYGRFVRGIDRTGRIDPDGQRPVGSSQEDSFKNHDHRVSVSRADTGTVGRGMLPYFEQRNHPEVRSSAEGGRETRPKNIALLYCIKQ